MLRGKFFKLAKLGLALILLSFYVFAQSGPQPGDVYKEIDLVNKGNDWRVTDPNATAPGADDFLPNPVLTMTIPQGDLVGAIKAELVIDLWGGHPGTTGKKFRFNNNAWETIDELTTTPIPTEGYRWMNQFNPVEPVNLLHLEEGVNTLEGTSGGQAVYNFGWGQWGWYGVILRIYYDPNQKSHPTGSITSISNGGNFNDNPVVSASASSSAGIKQVEFLGYYEGYDLDGDGIFQEWQGYYHREYSDTEMELKGNIGTDFSSPYSSSWNTSWVPDQVANSVKLQARIQDNNGIWYVTESVENLSLVRNDFSVKLFKGINVPERYWVPWGAVGSPYRNKSSYFSIPSSTNLSTVSEVQFFTRTWGNDKGTAPYLAMVNNNGIQNHGLDHFYKFDNFPISKSFVKTGTNTVTYQSNTTHHGSEVLWPGPAVMLKFGSVTNFPPSISQQPSNQTVFEGGTATFSVSASGTSPLSYQWKKNGSNISGANSTSYTTPALALSNNGDQYSCVVSNPYGSVTSNSATLTVLEFDGSNFAQNGNFEVGDVSNWVTGNTVGGAVYSFGVNSANPIAGNFDGKVQVISTGTSDSRPIVANQLSANMVLGQQYTVSFMTKVLSGSPAIKYISYGEGVKSFPGSLSGTQTWTFNVGSATVANDGIYLYVNGTSAGAFQVDNMVVNAGGSTGTAPTITTQPSNATVTEGQTATFNVAASGTAPLSYQWKKNGANISGANSASYTTPPTTLADDGAQFSVVVTNDYGSATSNNALLSVDPIVVGSVISINGNFETGTTSSWQAANHFGGATYSFGINTVNPIGDSYDGKMAITSAGTSESRPMLSNGLSESTIVGLPYVLSFTTKVLSGSPDISALYFGGSIIPFPGNLSGTQNWSLELPSATSVTSFISFYINGKAVGSFSIDNLVMTKGGSSSPPTIISQPNDATVIEGQTASFSVVASGSALLTYQWKKDGTDISGANSATYTTPATTSADNGSQYSVVVTNSYGSATSDPALLTVNSSVSNLSLNGNFENGSDSQWLDFNHFGGAVYSFGVNSGAPISGTYDGKLSVLTAGTASSRPMLANKLSEKLVLGQSYTVTFKTKVISGAPTIGYINYGLGVKSFTSNLSGTETWTFDVPSATSAIGYLYLYVDGRSAGTFTIDDVVVSPVGSGALASNSSQIQNQNNFEFYVQDGSSFNLTTQQLSNYFGKEISIASNLNHQSVDKVDAADAEAITHTMFDKNKRNDIRVFAYQKNQVEVTDHRIETRSLNSNQLLSRSVEELPLIIESNETVVIELEDQLLSLGFDLDKVKADILESENSSNVAVSITDGKLMLTAINVEEEISFDLPLVIYDGERKLLKDNLSTLLQPASTEAEIPTDFELSQNYPNPFNPSTTIKFGLPAESEVNLIIYNMLGEVVRILENKVKAAGYYEYQWNASDFSTGVYIYRFTATSLEDGQEFVQTKKLMLLK